MSEFPISIIAMLDRRVCKVKVIILTFGYKIQQVAKVSKIFETHSRCFCLNKIVSIHKVDDIEAKTRDIMGC